MGNPAAQDPGQPRYLQIADDLARGIQAGRPAPGEMLPSESELIDRYDVSGGTVRKAIAELRTRGLIETHHGKGSSVKKLPPVSRKSSDRFRRSHRKAGKAAYLAESEQMGVTPTVKVHYVGPTEVPEEIAERLGVTAGTKVLARRRLYFSDGIPTEEATSYLPWDVVKDIPEMFEEKPGGGGIYARLEEHGNTLHEFTETVRARLATKQETTALSLSPGSPVIHLTREARTDDGRVVEVCDTIMAADRFVLDYRIPAGD
ncbi:GntR family transcriptional regulator [Streptomyces sp. WAC 06738]|uniref:GntR family transcriptional regulator n=1 Tax=Streptomyces sp. WAC 06738 TaxID=2203210 RepID=UPI000F6B61A7|nr:GntR family transcriptional regulator [Streptomyces sp. WAC 06738]AZM47500.1 GntR family transcriptional regulator [Streptomyces sp. WAC 06738]